MFGPKGQGVIDTIKNSLPTEPRPPWRTSCGRSCIHLPPQPRKSKTIRRVLIIPFPSRCWRSRR